MVAATRVAAATTAEAGRVLVAVGRSGVDGSEGGGGSGGEASDFDVGGGDGGGLGVDCG